MNNYTNNSSNNKEDIDVLEDINTIEVWEALYGDKPLPQRTRRIMRAYILFSAKTIKEKPKVNTKRCSDRELIINYYNNEHAEMAFSLAASPIDAGIISLIFCILLIMFASVASFSHFSH